jgi:thiosulfate/3-mercaptopyruvate sulfurtransferase
MPYRTLVSVDELANLVDKGSVAVVDCRFSLADPAAGRAEYAAEHIPGAVYADLDEHLSSPITETSGRHPLPDPGKFARQLADWGIHPARQVVAYDNSGGAFAARFWWLARWVGLTDVAVLDSGWNAWVKSGHPTTSDVVVPTPTEFEPQIDHTQWISTASLISSLDKGEVLLVDAREPERYRGDTEPIDPVAGHVPGARNLPFKQNLSPTGAFLPIGELRQRFATVSELAAGKPIVHMCGSGVTACHNVLAMEHAGLPNSKLYAGSWSEYLRDPSRPVATGNG